MNQTASIAEPNLLLCAGLVLAGILTAFVKKLMDLESAGTMLSPVTYIRQAPYKALMAFMGAYIAMFVAYYMGQLNPLVAILTGLAGHEAFDSLRARAIKRMRLLDEGDGP